MPFDPNLRLIAPPRGIHRFSVALPAFRKFRDVPLDPTLNSRIGQIDRPLRHHFHQVAITSLVGHVPPDTEREDLGVKVTPLEQRNGRLVE